MVPKWAIIPVARTLIVQAFTDPWHDKRIIIDEEKRRVEAVRIVGGDPGKKTSGACER